MKSIIYHLSAILLTLASFTSSRAESPENVALRILESDPSMQSLYLDNEALKEALKTEANLPDPEIEGEYLFAPAGETNRWGAGLSWGLEWPGVYSARRNVNAGKIMVAEAGANMIKRERLIEIKRLLLDYVLQEKQLELLKNVNSVNDSIMTLAANAERGGEMTKIDLNKLKLERASLNSQIAEIMSGREETVSSLSSIYGGDCSALLKGMNCDFPALDPPSMNDGENSPEVIAARAEAEAAIKEEKAASMESLPGISIGYQHAFEEGIHFNGASLGISIPLFSSRNKKKAAKAATVAATHKAEAAKIAASEKIKGGLKRLSLLKNRIDEIRPILEDSGNNLLLMKAYKGGVITLIDYLNERNYFKQAGLDLLTLRYEAAITLLDLQQISD